MTWNAAGGYWNAGNGDENIMMRAAKKALGLNKNYTAKCIKGGCDFNVDGTNLYCNYHTEKPKCIWPKCSKDQSGEANIGNLTAGQLCCDHYDTLQKYINSQTK
eukprot:412098_1